MNAGLDHLFGIGQSSTIQVILIAGITALATWSVLAGLSAGIRRLSEINLVLALVLCLFVLVVGPTLFILNAFGENLGHYLQYLPQLSTWNETYEASAWQNSWTVFYWGWWIAWSPFVGMFIARVSYGRTVREFIIGVLFVPTLITFAWLTIFGNSALQVEILGGGGIARAVQENIPVALFSVVGELSASGSYLHAHGDRHRHVLCDVIGLRFHGDRYHHRRGETRIRPRCSASSGQSLEGAVAAALLVGGGLVALQTGGDLHGPPVRLGSSLHDLQLAQGTCRLHGRPGLFHASVRTRSRFSYGGQPSGTGVGPWACELVGAVATIQTVATRKTVPRGQAGPGRQTPTGRNIDARCKARRGRKGRAA